MESFQINMTANVENHRPLKYKDGRLPTSGLVVKSYRSIFFCLH